MNHLAKVTRVLAAAALVMLATVPALADSTYTVFVAGLDGASEVPPNASQAYGHANIFLNQAQTQATYYVSYSGLVGETAAHFHVGAPGVNGPVVFPLPAGNPKTGVWNLTAQDVTDLYAGNIYVNIHSEQYPGGEIRGNFEFCVVPAEAQTWSQVKALFQ